MKIAIVLCALIGASLASPLLSYGKNVNTGRSQVSRSDDGHGNYQFGYDEEHHEGGTSRRESGGKGWQKGSYELRDRDGRKRTVNYVADAHGFRAQVDTNEPGVDSKEDPADVKLSGRPIYVQEPIRVVSYAVPQTYKTVQLSNSYDDGSYRSYGSDSYDNNDNYGYSGYSAPSSYSYSTKL